MRLGYCGFLFTSALVIIAAGFVVQPTYSQDKPYPLVYTYQLRDTKPILNAKTAVNGVQVPVQIDEGANWQAKMDAGRFFFQTESDIVIDDLQGNKTYLTNCIFSPEICATQSATVSHDAKYIVYQKSKGHAKVETWAMYTQAPTNDWPFNAYTNELWAYEIATKEHTLLRTGYQDITPSFCGGRLVWASDQFGSFPPYAKGSGNPYRHRGTTILSADFNDGKLGEVKNLTPHEMLVMSPECLSNGYIIYSSWQGYPKRGEYQFTTTSQNLWWVNIIDGNGANALTIASLGAHNSPYIPTAELIQDELSDWGGATVSTMLILRPCRQVGLKNGLPYIVCGNYYRTNHVAGGGELLGYTFSLVEGVWRIKNWEFRQAGADSGADGSGAFVPKDLQSLTRWGHGFDNPQRFDKQGRIMGKSNYAAPYPGGRMMFTWFDGACYEPVLSQGIDWATRKKMGGGPTCQLKICVTDMGTSNNPHKECEILVGEDEAINAWDSHVLAPYSALLGQERPIQTPETLLKGATELRVVDFGAMQLKPRPSGDKNQELKNRYMNQGHATPDVDNGRMDKFCVDVVEPHTELPEAPGYKSRTLFGCAEAKPDGSIAMKVPHDALILMYGVDSSFEFKPGTTPEWFECINVLHGMCVVAEDQMLHSLRKGEKRTCHGCHDAHGEERFQELGRQSAEQRFMRTQSFIPPGCG